MIFVAPLCEKVIFVSDKNYMTSAIRKFTLDMPSPGSFQTIAQQDSDQVKLCGSN